MRLTIEANLTQQRTPTTVSGARLGASAAKTRGLQKAGKAHRSWATGKWTQERRCALKTNGRRLLPFCLKRLAQSLLVVHDGVMLPLVSTNQ